MAVVEATEGRLVGWGAAHFLRDGALPEARAQKGAWLAWRRPPAPMRIHAALTGQPPRMTPP
jgi:hypothetical protein